MDKDGATAVLQECACVVVLLRAAVVRPRTVLCMF